LKWLVTSDDMEAMETMSDQQAAWTIIWAVASGEWCRRGWRQLMTAQDCPAAGDIKCEALLMNWREGREYSEVILGGLHRERHGCFVWFGT
jgi:hypothetical protein